MRGGREYALRKAILGRVFDFPPSVLHHRERYGVCGRDGGSRGGSEGGKGREGMESVMKAKSGASRAKKGYEREMTVDFLYRRGDTRCYQNEYRRNNKRDL